MTFTGDADGSWTAGDLTLHWGARTDVGHHRRVNEDSVLIRPPVFAVADGMGGHAAGDTASGIAVERLAEAAEGTGARRAAIVAALNAAAADIDRLSEELGVDAGTTATGFCVSGEESGRITVFNVGDSRVYSMADGRLEQITIDHSLVQEMVDAGELDPDEAESHPASNVITRALGFREEPRPDFAVLPHRELRIVVCSDGLTKEVDARHLRLLVGAGLDPGVTAQALVDAALAAGGHDNVSVIVVDVRLARVSGAASGAD